MLILSRNKKEVNIIIDTRLNQAKQFKEIINSDNFEHSVESEKETRHH